MISSPQQGLVPFAFEDSLVRCWQDEHGNPWFVVKDVCAVLDISNHRDAVTNLDEDEKGVAITDTPGGEQEMLTVSESGLYSLIFRSRKPEARAFRKWVTGEVLPTLRQTGRYGSPAPEGPRMAPGPIDPVQLHKLLAVWAMLARTPFEALRDQLFGMFGIADVCETPQAVLQAAGEHVLHQNNTLLAEGRSPDSNAVAAYERRVSIWREPEAARLFWQQWERLNEGGRLNHSRNPDLVALRLTEATAAAQAHGLPFTLTELRTALPLGRLFRFLGRGRAVNSVHTGKTVRCMVFYTPAPAEAPHSEEQEVRS